MTAAEPDIVVLTKDAVAFQETSGIIFAIGDADQFDRRGGCYDPRRNVIRCHGIEASANVDTGQDVPPYLVWRNRKKHTVVIEWPKKQWQAPLQPPHYHDAPVLQLYQNDWQTNGWYWGPIAHWDRAGHVCNLLVDGGPAAMAIPFGEIHRASQQRDLVYSPNPFSCLDRCFYDWSIQQTALTHIACSASAIMVAVQMFFLKRHCPDLEKVSLPQSFDLATGWRRYGENLGILITKEKGLNIAVPDVATHLSEAQIKQVLATINAMSPIIPEKLAVSKPSS